MKNDHTKVTFRVHPVSEFISGLDFLANTEKYNRLFKDYHYQQDEDVEAKVAFMATKASRFLKKEIEYFFKLPEIVDVMGRLIIEIPDLVDVNAFVEHLEKIDARTLLTYIIERFYLDSPEQFETIMEGMAPHAPLEEISYLVMTSETIDEAARDKLLDMIESPEEIKLRLTLLLRQFYEKCYAPVETEIIETLEASREKFESMFERDRAQFYEAYLREQSLKDVKEFVIHIGYFVQIGRWKFLITPTNRTEYISIGMHADQYPHSSFQKIRVEKFLKLLADEKRFKMIQLLGKRAWYGYELAETLSITPPTVSYHMNSMMELGLIYLERDSNRTYYHLDQNKLKELLEMVEKALIPE